jgi:formylglycine-generating enzyme required for sulfatase activity
MFSDLAQKNNFLLFAAMRRYLLAGLLCTLCPGIHACSDTADRMPGSAGNQKACASMVVIPAGDFIMGTDEAVANRDEKPAHTVTVSAFYIDCCEVTNAEYRDFVIATGHKPPRVEAAWAEPYNWIGNDFPPGTDLNPVVLVSWHDATVYAAWAGKRLPTEAEWEKAARAGMVGRSFPYGDTIEARQANYFISYLRKKMLRPVGSFEPNAYGLYDMAGNVWEWCRDWYTPDYYRKSAAINPSGPLHAEYKVFRGGSWESDKEFLRCAQRGKNRPDYKSPAVGFRCVRPADQSAESDE